MQALDINGRDAASELRDWRIFIPKSRLPELNSENDFYFHSVEGAAVVLDTGEPLGHIRRIIETSCEVLEIARIDGSELLVPVLKDTVQSFGPPVVLFAHILDWFDLSTDEETEPNETTMNGKLGGE